MKHRYITTSLVSFFLLIASQTAAAQSNNCGAVDPSAPAWFEDKLDNADKAQARGQLKSAYEHLERAQYLPVRVDVSVNPRCVGPALWQRFYDLRRQVTQMLGEKAEQTGLYHDYDGAFHWYVTGDSRDDVDRVIDNVKLDANHCSWAAGHLDGTIGILEHASNQGVPLIADEVSAAGFYREKRQYLEGWADQQAAEILAREDALLKADISEYESQLESAEQQAYDLAAAMVGEDALAGPNEARREVRRAQESLRMIREAEGWTVYFDNQDRQYQERANLRGDALMVKGDDTSHSLEARDAYYEMAGSYYGYGWLADDDRVRRADEARAAIAPALEKQREEQAARLEAKQEEFVESAREMQESMQMSEEEQQSFKDEADALEDELGF